MYSAYAPAIALLRPGRLAACPTSCLLFYGPRHQLSDPPPVLSSGLSDPSKDHSLHGLIVWNHGCVVLPFACISPPDKRVFPPVDVSLASHVRLIWQVSSPTFHLAVSFTCLQLKTICRPRCCNPKFRDPSTHELQSFVIPSTHELRYHVDCGRMFRNVHDQVDSGIVVHTI